ncbi:unnamed protein product [Amoebophrya sp. A120]|nr:unnamed protein product [Amoebophrya sp. A120]|eukprot:GSA120T00000456001.1
MSTATTSTASMQKQNCRFECVVVSDAEADEYQNPNAARFSFSHLPS